ncbi:rhodanese-like domain-containing protein [Arenibaculum pallidiluteum]|uniref:rhodanese-like domain-containing protein n=1 Tax=Arenibaculum pallidiluteum TaxID=2812559 RepID=UPI001F3C99B2|nr:rhodanese-like domain-containing protein [Arenibaculum pallidiluteum]
MEIEVEDLRDLLQGGRDVAVLDVREPWELDICRLPDSLDIPLSVLTERTDALPRDRTLVVVCHHGARSAHATAWLRRNGFENAVNLGGGIDAWARRVDPNMRTY